jgi:hypothetical protein
MAWVTERRIYVAIDCTLRSTVRCDRLYVSIDKQDRNYPLETAMCDPLHVTRVEPINGHSQQN